ncbi:hypothetical protein CLV40_11040 [Actinokineospora auranticolor]|uniref:Uncharacterized protein n=1 Tax=Actinokineospora auranticolor TaxID=155976 RepID=A0A2S6GME9_9PSEU|nr:hypothetical protein CLV40_11040 [Actinokineospora auranticolor]
MPLFCRTGAPLSFPSCHIRLSAITPFPGHRRNRAREQDRSVRLSAGEAGNQAVIWS